MNMDTSNGWTAKYMYYAIEMTYILFATYYNN